MKRNLTENEFNLFFNSLKNEYKASKLPSPSKEYFRKILSNYLEIFKDENYFGFILPSSENPQFSNLIFISNRTELPKLLSKAEKKSKNFGKSYMISRIMFNSKFTDIFYNSGFRDHIFILRNSTPFVQKIYDIHPYIIKTPTIDELKLYHKLVMEIFKKPKIIWDSDWKSLFEEPYSVDPKRFWVAILNNEVVGGIGVLYYNWYQEETTNFIFGLCVKPNHRCKKIGTALLNKAIEFSNTINRPIELKVEVQNQNVIQWYLNLRFYKIFLVLKKN